MTSIKNITVSIPLRQAMNYAQTNPCHAWYSDFSGFKEPFNIRESVEFGTDKWANSLYASVVGSKLAMNPCYLVRKSLYRLVNLSLGKNLGYIYTKGDETWCSYYDGTMKEVNQVIDTGKSSCERWIHLHLVNGNIESACVEDKLIGSRQQYKIGNGNGYHSPSAFVYAKIVDAIFREKKALYKDRFDIICQKILNGVFDKKEDSETLTVLENDIFIDLAQRNDVIKLFKPMQTLCDKKFPEGTTTIYDLSSFEAKPKAKRTMKVTKTINTVADAVKSGMFKINHTFNGDEQLVPTIYDDFDLTPKEQRICKLIKANEKIAQMGCGNSFMNFMFTGEAGTGKSTAAQMIAAICGLPYRFITCSSSTEETELKTQTIIDPNDGSRFVNVDSEVINAIRYGGIIEVQEINMIRREGVAACLNSVLDGIGKIKLLDGSMLERHPHCVFIFTMNVGYEGSKNLNQALLSRCFCKEEFVLPSEEELVNRLLKKQGLTKELAEKMVKVFFEVRNCLEVSGETNGVCSYRELDAWGEMLSRNYVICQKIAGFPKMTEFKAAEKSLVSHATEDKDLQAELCAVISKTFPAFDY